MKIRLILITILMSLTLSACAESTPTIESVETFEALTVPRFAEFDDFDLPDFVNVTYTNGNQEALPVNWDVAEARFDSTRIGEAELTGRFLLQNQENPEAIAPKVPVIIEAVDWQTTLAKNPNYSMFHQAFEASSVDVSSLGDDFTLFVPTNEAFETILDLLGLSMNGFLESDTLDNVVMYHIMDEAFTAQGLLGEVPAVFETMEGSSLNMDFDGEFLTLNVINRVVRTNEPNTDIAMHQVDGVLLPPSTFEGDLQSVINSQALNLFTGALGDLNLDVTELLSSEFTIFAPNQTAFEALAAERGVTVTELLTQDDIGEILTYHIVEGEYTAETLFLEAPSELVSVQGATLTVEVIDDIIHVNGVPIEDSQTTGQIGIIHTISEVLTIPEVPAE